MAKTAILEIAKFGPEEVIYRVDEKGIHATRIIRNRTGYITGYSKMPLLGFADNEKGTMPIFKADER